MTWTACLPREHRRRDPKPPSDKPEAVAKGPTVTQTGFRGLLGWGHHSVSRGGIRGISGRFAMASSASSMNATTGSSAAGWGSVLGVNSGGKLGFGVLDIPEPNTIRLGRAAAEVPHLAKHRPGFPRISGDTLTTRAHG